MFFLSAQGRIRTHIKGFGDLYSTLELLARIYLIIKPSLSRSKCTSLHCRIAKVSLLFIKNKASLKYFKEALILFIAIFFAENNYDIISVT